ncbi:MAG: peptidylprolyl isomerase [Erysipelotrichaceae bacterium]|nr:peptidylprolyl isomerase [Erysipelotrichaceae bacterium]
MKLLKILIMILLLSLSACAVKEEKTEETIEESEQVQLVHAQITIKDYGTVTLELYPDIAPITVENFVKLAEEGFYDGNCFHRIIDGFMIQGGAPQNEKVKSIKGEFSSNGFENDLKHTEGVISMARAKDPDSASSQFFIMVGDASWLDGQYAAFGKVTDGLDIVKKIASDAKPYDDNGSIVPEERPVIESIRIID